MLLRTSSAPLPTSFFLSSPRSSFPDQDCGAGLFFSQRSSPSSPKLSLNIDKNDFSGNFRRARSESDLIGKVSRTGLFRSSSSKILEEDSVDQTIDLKRFSLGINGFDVNFQDNNALMKELEFPGGVGGTGWRNGNGGHNGDSYGDNSDQRKMRDYYEKLLRENPGDTLLLRNYGRYLQEVEKDFDKAEECYERAILTSPGDGEVLSFYGNLIWETKHDEEKAEIYFDQAIRASPDDCYVLGSYAHFLWDVEDEENRETDVQKEVDRKSSTLVKAY